jgi:ketosteroid isomerase-like protein
LFVECANERDTAGIAAPYDEDGVMANPPGRQTACRAAIRVLWKKVLANAPHSELEPPLPTRISGDIALTSTHPEDGVGALAQVARRQPDCTWPRLLDQPEFVPRAPGRVTPAAKLDL